jgi:prophage tail gpP-like protein
MKGDTLWGIAGQAYGNVQRWPEIYDANKAVIGPDPDLIFPGVTLLIPGELPLVIDVEDDSELLPNADPDGFQLVIKGKEVNVESARVLRTMDTGSDMWSAQVYWDPEDKDLSDLFKPFSFYESKAYVGGQLLVTGPVMVQEPAVNNDKVSMTLQGFSKTIHMVDSHVKPPYQRREITLVKLAEELIKGQNLSLIDNTNGAADGSFKRATAEATDKIFDFLIKMAKQKSVLATSTPRGDLLLTQTAAKTENFGSIGDDQSRGHDWRARFNGRERFREYRMLGKRRGRKVATKTVLDENITAPRHIAIQSSDLAPAELEKAANWERSKKVSTALKIPFPVSGWYAPNGDLWRENKYVTVVSKRIFVPDGFDFLIRSLEYIYEPSGRKTILNLVPPGVFTGEPVEEPWF